MSNMEKISSLQKQLQDQMMLHGEQHDSVARLHNEIGSAYYAMGEYKAAFDSYNTALEMGKESLGELHEFVIDTHYRIGKVLEAMVVTEDKLQEPKMHMQENLLMRKQYDATHRSPRDEDESFVRPENTDAMDSTLIYNDMAEEARLSGDFDRALPLYMKSIDLRRKKFGDSSPALPPVLINYAELLRQQNQLEAAEGVLNEAMAICLSTFGKQHPTSAEVINNLGIVYRQQGDLDKAYALLMEALQLRRQLLGDLDLYVAATLNNIAELLREKKEFQEAINYHHLSIEAFEKTGGEHHPGTINAKGNLGITLRRYAKKNMEYGETLIRDTVDYFHSNDYNEQHPWLTKFSNEHIINEAQKLAEQGKYEQSLELYDGLFQRKLEMMEMATSGIRSPVKGTSASSPPKSPPKSPMMRSAETSMEEAAQDLVLIGKGKFFSMLGKGRMYLARAKFLVVDEIIEECKVFPTEWLGTEKETILIELKLLEAQSCFQKSDFDHALQLSVEALQEKTDIYGPDSESLAEIMIVIAECYRAKANYEEAESFLTQTLKLINFTISKDEQAIGKPAPAHQLLYISAVVAMAEVNRNKGSYSIAVPLLKEAIDICTENLFEDEAVMGECFISLGCIERIKGDYIKAEEYFERSLENRTKNFGRHHPKTASALGHQAMMQLLNRKYDVAEKLINECYEIQTSYYQEVDLMHPVISNAMYLRGCLKQAQLQLHDAQSLLMQVMDAQVAKFGDQHPVVGRTMCTLATVLQDQYHFQEAASYHEQALSIRRAAFEDQPYHHYITESLFHVASIAAVQGMLEQSMPMFEACLEARQELHSFLGTRYHHVTASYSLRYAEVQLQRGLVNDALKRVGECGAAMFNVFQHQDNLSIADCLFVLAEVYKELGKNRDAKQQYSLSMAIRYRHLGKHHPLVLETLYAAAENMRRVGYFHDALDACTALEALSKEGHGEGSVQEAIAHKLHAHILCDRAKTPRAEELYEQALSVLQPVFGDMSFHVAEIKFGMGRCMHITNNLSGAEEAYQEAKAIAEALTGPNSHLVMDIRSNLLMLKLNGKPVVSQAAVDTLRNDVLAFYSANYPQGHPYIAHANGRIGLLMNGLKQNSGGRFIRKALKYFDEMKQYPYAYDHPWVMELGGYEKAASKDRLSHAVEVQALSSWSMPSFEGDLNYGQVPKHFFIDCKNNSPDSWGRVHYYGEKEEEPPDSILPILAEARQRSTSPSATSRRRRLPDQSARAGGASTDKVEEIPSAVPSADSAEEGAEKTVEEKLEHEHAKRKKIEDALHDERHKRKDLQELLDEERDQKAAMEKALQEQQEEKEELKRKFEESLKMIKDLSVKANIESIKNDDGMDVDELFGRKTSETEEADAAKDDVTATDGPTSAQEEVDPKDKVATDGAPIDATAAPVDGSETVTATPDLPGTGAAEGEDAVIDEEALKLQNHELEAADYLYSRAKRLHDDGWFATAQPLFEECLRLRRVHVPSGAVTNEAERSLAENLTAMHRWDEAQAVAEHCVEHMTTTFGNDNALRAESLIVKGENEIAKGLYKDAATTLKNASELAGRLAEKDKSLNALRGKALVAQAECSLLLGKISESKAMVERGSAILSKSVGIYNLHYVRATQVKVDTLLLTSKFKESLNLAEQLYTVRKRLQGEIHPTVASSLMRMGLSLIGVGKLHEGVEKLDNALRMRMHFFGDDSFEAAELYQHKGQFCSMFCRYQEALHFQTRAFDIRRRICWEHHPALGASHHALGDLYTQLAQYDRAAMHFETAMTIRSRLPPSENAFHPSVAATKCSTAAMMRLRGDYQGARPLLEESLEERRTLFGKENVEYLLNQQEFANLLHDTGDLVNADKLTKRTIKKLRTLIGMDHPEYADCLQWQAEILVGMKMFDEASVLLAEASQVLRIHFAEGDDFMIHRSVIRWRILKGILLIAQLEQRGEEEEIRQQELAEMKRATEANEADHIGVEEPVLHENTNSSNIAAPQLASAVKQGTDASVEPQGASNGTMIASDEQKSSDSAPGTAVAGDTAEPPKPIPEGVSLSTVVDTVQYTKLDDSQNAEPTETGEAAVMENAPAAQPMPEAESVSATESNTESAAPQPIFDNADFLNAGEVLGKAVDYLKALYHGTDGGKFLVHMGDIINGQQNADEEPQPEDTSNENNAPSAPEDLETTPLKPSDEDLTKIDETNKVGDVEALTSEPEAPGENRTPVAPAEGQDKASAADESSGVDGDAVAINTDTAEAPPTDLEGQINDPNDSTAEASATLDSAASTNNEPIQIATDAESLSKSGADAANSETVVDEKEEQKEEEQPPSSPLPKLPILPENLPIPCPIPQCNVHPLIRFVEGKLGSILLMEYLSKQRFANNLTPEQREVFNNTESALRLESKEVKTKPSGLPEMEAAVADLKSFPLEEKHIWLLQLSSLVKAVVFTLDDMDIAANNFVIAESLREMGRYADAAGKYEEVFVMQMSSLGAIQASTSMVVAETLYAQAENCRMMGDVDLSKALYNQSISIFRRKLGSDSEGVLKGIVGLTSLLYMQGLYDDAYALHNSTLDIYKKTSGEKSLQVARMKTLVGFDLLRLGKLEAAMTNGRESLSQLNKITSNLKSTDDVVSARLLLAYGLIALGDFPHAREQVESLQQLLEGSDTDPAQDHLMLSDVQICHAELLFVTGKLFDAEKLIQKALHARIKLYGRSATAKDSATGNERKIQYFQCFDNLTIETSKEDDASVTDGSEAKPARRERIEQEDAHLEAEMNDAFSEVKKQFNVNDEVAAMMQRSDASTDGNSSNHNSVHGTDGKKQQLEINDNATVSSYVLFVKKVRPKAPFIFRGVQIAAHPALVDCLHLKGRIELELHRFTECKDNFNAALTMLQQLFARPSQKKACITFELANMTYAQGFYEDARGMHNNVLQERLQLCDEDHPDKADSLFQIARINNTLSKFEDSTQILSEALAIRKRVYGEKHWKVAEIFIECAAVLHAKGFHSDSDALHDKAMHVLKKQFGDIHQLISTVLLGQATNACELGVYEQANALIEQAAAMRGVLVGDKHGETAQCAYRQAMVMRELGRYLDAKKLLDQAIATQRETLGKYHPHTATTLLGLAFNFMDLAKYSTAGHVFNRALHLVRKGYGKDHVLVATSLTGIAENLHHQAFFSAAKENHEKALYIRRKLLGERHHSLAESIAHIASIQLALSQLEEATKSFDDALALQRMSLGQSHPAIAVTMHGLANVLLAQGKVLEAKTMHERAFTMRKACLSGDHPAIGYSQFNIAMVFRKMGRYDQSGALFERCLNTVRDSIGSRHPMVGQIIYNSGDVANQMGRYHHAEALLLESLTIRMQTFKDVNENHPAIYESYYGLGENLRLRGLYDFQQTQMIPELQKFRDERMKLQNTEAANAVEAGKAAAEDAPGAFDQQIGGNTAEHEEAIIDTIFAGGDPEKATEQSIPAPPATNEKDGSILTPATTAAATEAVDETATPITKGAVKEPDVFDINADDNATAPTVRISAIEQLDGDGSDDEENEDADGNDFDNRALVEDEKAYKALPMLKRVLDAFSITYHEEHPIILMVQHSIAECMVALGKYDAAIEQHETLLGLRKKTLGDFHPDTLLSMLALGEALKAIGKIYPDTGSGSIEAKRARIAKQAVSLGVTLIDHFTAIVQPCAPLPPETRPASASAAWMSTPLVTSHSSKAVNTSRPGTQQSGSGGKAMLSKTAPLPHEWRFLSQRPVKEKKKKPLKIPRGYMGYPFPKEKRLIRKEDNNVTRPNKTRTGDAMWLYEASAAALKKQYGDQVDHPLLAALLFARGDLLKARGDYAPALQMFEQSIIMRRKLFRGNHPVIADCINAMAEIFRLDHKYRQALPMFDKALEIRNEAYEDGKHVSVAEVKNNIAMLFFAEGKFEEAEKHFEAALSLCEELMGLQHPGTAVALNNLAGLLHAAGQHSQALPLYQRSLKVKIATFGEEHADVASTMNNIGLLYRTVGKLEDAEKMYEQALAIQKKLHGTTHKDIATTMNNLAALYASQGKRFEAKEMYKDCIAMRSALFGSEHPSVAATLNNYAGLLFTINEFDHAKDFFEDALRIRKKVLGDEHPSVAETLNNIGLLLYKQGHLKEALPVYQRCLDIKVAAYGEMNPSVATSINNLAGLYHKLGHFDHARSLYERAQSIRQVVLGDSHPDTKLLTENLKLVERDRKKWANVVAAHEHAEGASQDGTAVTASTSKASSAPGEEAPSPSPRGAIRTGKLELGRDDHVTFDQQH